MIYQRDEVVQRSNKSPIVYTGQNNYLADKASFITVAKACACAGTSEAVPTRNSIRGLLASKAGENNKKNAKT